MPSRTPELLLRDLEAARYSFAPRDGARVDQLLRSLDRQQFPDSSSLIRFHEALLFIRAFPHNRAVLRTSERILKRFYKKVEALRESHGKNGADMDAFDTFEHAGIAGTRMEDTLSFDVARWLVRRLRGKVEIAWENYEPGRELGTTGPRFMPLLEDDAFVEADTPWRRWLESAATGRSAIVGNKAFGNLVSRKRKEATAAWLIERFEDLPAPESHKAELYESLRIPLCWEPGNSSLSRTRNWRPVRKVFYHNGPLLSRSQVSLPTELAKHPPTFTRLSRREGEQIAEMIREVMLVRYRELYGTTLADPRSVVRADLGGADADGDINHSSRGISIYLWNLPPERRLPLRAYVAGFTLKNGVPINYIEAIGLCEWMEVGFNTFYTFRGGEAGWIYAQVLRCLCSWMGTTTVSVYPYQLGHDNDEAIQSGAFWFYRKLGFRPARADLLKLAEREEKKIAAAATKKAGAAVQPYRTPARILKCLAASHVFYELPGSEVGAWDRFSTRNIGLLVNSRMAAKFGGNATRMREHSRRSLERILGVKTANWSPLEKQSFDNFALVLALPQAGLSQVDLRRWTSSEKQNLIRVIRAKAKPDEMLYLHLTQQHSRLRETLLELGS